MRYSLRPVLLCLAVSSALILDDGPVAAGEVYKWVDSKGRTHFGDKPPKSVKSATRIDTSAATRISADPDAGAHRDKQQRLLKALSSERKEREEVRRKARLRKAERKRKCASVRHNLTLLEQSNLLYKKDKNGERQYASDAQREQLIEQMKATLREHCSSG